ncbi:unnamed protein product [Rotaria magnacalcarata]|uniref:Uncharacterized protein n=1 Tax=Rotaria magnacalcarata TaxID=392030 RepID=A0A816NRK1_9BILA|nr:unnamed protein product [Rotaria magnacalcarata]
MISQLVGKRIIHKGFQTKNKFEPKFEGPFQIISVDPNERSYQIAGMVNEVTPMYNQPIKVHHSNLRPWVPRPNYLAKFDLGGEVFPPPARLNQPSSNNNARMPNTRIFNHFIGFTPATPPVQPVAPGGNNITPPVIGEVVEPLNGEIGGESPHGGLSPQPEDILESPNFTPPRNLNLSLPNLFSPLENRDEDNYRLEHPFEGFPFVDPSTDDLLTRMENLLTSPNSIKKAPLNKLPMPSVLLPDELPIINPPSEPKLAPLVIPIDLLSIPSTSTSNITIPSTSTITDEPVLSKVPITPSEVIETPPPPLDPNIGVSPQGTVRSRSRIPVLSPIASPISRLRPSNTKPQGFYRK